MFSLNARGEGAAAPGRLIQQVDLMKAEKIQRSDLELYAYDLGKQLCYIFQFRNAHNLPLQTTWYSWPVEDAKIGLNVYSDVKLQESIKAWLTLGWFGFVAPYYHNVGTIVSSESLLHDRLQHSKELERAVKDCGDEIHVDLKKIFDTELDRQDSVQGFMSSYGLFTLAGGVGSGAGIFSTAFRKIAGVFTMKIVTGLAVASIAVAVTAVVQESRLRSGIVEDAKAVAKGELTSRNTYADGVMDDNLNFALASFGRQYVRLQDKSHLPPSLIVLSNRLDQYPLIEHYEKLKKEVDNYSGGQQGLQVLLQKQKNQIALNDDEQAMLDKLQALGGLQIYFNWKKSLTTAALEKTR
jgi:hypothetical protein